MAGALSNGRFPLIQRRSCSISRSRFSALIPPETLELFAQTTLRPRPGGGYELCCSPEHGAQIFEFYFGWAMQAPDFLEHLDCPAIAIGSDPTSSHSYMPSIDLSVLNTLHYQLEDPKTCAALIIDFLEKQALAHDFWRFFRQLLLSSDGSPRWRRIGSLSKQTKGMPPDL